MDRSELEKRIAWFDETANVFGLTPQDPEERLTLLYEDFAVSVHSFFHPLNLDILLRAGIITPEIKALCLTIRKQVEYLTQLPDPVEHIQGDRRWEEVFAWCQQVRALKQQHTRHWPGV
jgi:hypothetical protein